MIRNVSLENAAIAENEKEAIGSFEIPEENRQEFITAMKIGYYREFRKQGLISDDELEILITMQNKKSNSIKNAA